MTRRCSITAGDLCILLDALQNRAKMIVGKPDVLLDGIHIPLLYMVQELTIRLWPHGS
jgi:hypothetical protein